MAEVSVLPTNCQNGKNSRELFVRSPSILAACGYSISSCSRQIPGYSYSLRLVWSHSKSRQNRRIHLELFASLPCAECTHQRIPPPSARHLVVSDRSEPSLAPDTRKKRPLIRN